MGSTAPWIKAFALSALALAAPAKPLFIAAIVLVILDTISGVMSALKRGEPIRSAGLRRSVAKALVYEVAILSAFIAEKWLLADLLPASKLVAGAIGAVELKSVLENLNTVAGGSLFGSIVGRLGSANDPSKDKGKQD
jgi:hypothetical protein